MKVLILQVRVRPFVRDESSGLVLVSRSIEIAKKKKSLKTNDVHVRNARCLVSDSLQTRNCYLIKLFVLEKCEQSAEWLRKYNCTDSGYKGLQFNCSKATLIRLISAGGGGQVCKKQ